ncbi:MAG: PIN domain nuclease [Chloroflexi bacterium]|nr:PIN domain nuclease [Chloroflexota bacterium]
MSFSRTVRVIGMLLFAAAGFLLALYLSPVLYGDSPNSFSELVLPLTIVGAIVGLMATPYLTVYPLRAARNRLRLMPATDLLWATLGLFVGLVLGALISWPLSILPGWVGRVAPTVATLLLACVGVYAAILRKRDLLDTLHSVRGTVPSQAITGSKVPQIESMFINGNQPGDNSHAGEKIQLDKYLLVDTSAIIDGRIADISKTGFIDGTLLVPRFVLNELQHIADSPDPLRRARGRRGLDMLNRLQKEAVAPIQISEVDAEDIPEVDGKLVKIARVYRCPVITNDFNLNRVAEIQGVKVLNINELANAVKPVVIPGEEMNVRVIQEGKELGQGVAYLDDGTMVVVENGRKYLHNDVEVVVTRVLQTVAGRMIFAQMKNGRS